MIINYPPCAVSTYFCRLATLIGECSNGLYFSSDRMRTGCGPDADQLIFKNFLTTTPRHLRNTKLTALEISEDTVIAAGCRQGTDAVTMWKMSDSEMVKASDLGISSEINTVQLHCDLLLFHTKTDHLSALRVQGRFADLIGSTTH